MAQHKQVKSAESGRFPPFHLLFQFEDKSLGIGNLHSVFKPVVPKGQYNIYTEIRNWINESVKVSIRWPVKARSTFDFPDEQINFKTGYGYKRVTVLHAADDYAVVEEHMVKISKKKTASENPLDVDQNDEADLFDDNLSTNSSSSEQDHPVITQKNPNDKALLDNVGCSVTTLLPISPSTSSLSTKYPTITATPTSNSPVPTVPVTASKTTPASSLKRTLRQMTEEHDGLLMKISKLENQVAEKDKLIEELLAEKENFDADGSIASQRAEILKKEEELEAVKTELTFIKSQHPQVLAETLRDSLSVLQGLISSGNVGENSIASNNEQRVIRPGESKVKLDPNSDVMIDRNALKNAMAYGKGGNTAASRNAMINVILEALFTRPFMASHSLTGKKCPTDKSGNVPKPALPVEEVQAITSFAMAFWIKNHKCSLEKSLINKAITAKLLSEHTLHNNMEAAAAALEVAV